VEGVRRGEARRPQVLGGHVLLLFVRQGRLGCLLGKAGLARQALAGEVGTAAWLAASRSFVESHAGIMVVHGERPRGSLRRGLLQVHEHFFENDPRGLLHVRHGVNALRTCEQKSGQRWETGLRAPDSTTQL
jgi:hypothetical protein